MVKKIKSTLLYVFFSARAHPDDDIITISSSSSSSSDQKWEDDVEPDDAIFINVKNCSLYTLLTATDLKPQKS